MSPVMRRLLPVLASATVLSGCAGAVPAAQSSPTSSATVVDGATARARRIEPQPSPGSCHGRGGGPFSLPDPRCTPGALNPAVTPTSIDATICRSGYTRRIRPPESVTEPEKLASMAAYGDRESPRRYEYDHLVSLELGGASNDPRNLWPQPGASPNRKDELERRLHSLVCDRRLGLRAAQRLIARDWVGAYRQLLG